MTMFAPGIETRVVSWYLRFRNLFHRHEPSWLLHRFGGLRPGVEDINHLALVTQDFRAHLLAYTSGIDARQPERNGMQNEHGHSLRAALSFDLRKNKVFSDRFCTSNALRLRGCIDLEIFAEETKDYPWLPIRQAHNNDRLAIKCERLLLNWKKILLFVQHAPRKGIV